MQKIDDGYGSSSCDCSWITIRYRSLAKFRLGEIEVLHEQHYVGEGYLTVVLMRTRMVMCFAVGWNCKSSVHGCRFCHFLRGTRGRNKRIRLRKAVHAGFISFSSKLDIGPTGFNWEPTSFVLICIHFSKLAMKLAWCYVGVNGRRISYYSRALFIKEELMHNISSRITWTLFIASTIAEICPVSQSNLNFNTSSLFYSILRFSC